MKSYVCLYSVEYMTIDSGDLRVDYGLIYADNFTDAVEQLEQCIYGEDLMKINSIELFDTSAIFSEETFNRVREDLEAL